MRNEWISVKDRLPEIKPCNESDFVLCYQKPDYGMMAAPEIWIFYLCKYDHMKSAQWRFIGENNPGKITHWMPLPEPPQIRKKGH